MTKKGGTIKILGKEVRRIIVSADPAAFESSFFLEFSKEEHSDVNVTCSTTNCPRIDDIFPPVVVHFKYSGGVSYATICRLEIDKFRTTAGLKMYYVNKAGTKVAQDPLLSWWKGKASEFPNIW